MDNSRYGHRWPVPSTYQCRKIVAALRMSAGPGVPCRSRTRSYHERAYQAASWLRVFRVSLKANVMALGDHPQFVVTTLDHLSIPECLYWDIYSACGQDRSFRGRR